MIKPQQRTNAGWSREDKCPKDPFPSHGCGRKSTWSKIASKQNFHSLEKVMPRLRKKSKKKRLSAQAKMLTTVSLRSGTTCESGPSDRLHWLDGPDTTCQVFISHHLWRRGVRRVSVMGDSELVFSRGAYQKPTDTTMFERVRGRITKTFTTAVQYTMQVEVVAPTLRTVFVRCGLESMRYLSLPRRCGPRRVKYDDSGLRIIQRKRFCLSVRVRFSSSGRTTWHADCSMSPQPTGFRHGEMDMSTKMNISMNMNMTPPN